MNGRILGTVLLGTVLLATGCSDTDDQGRKTPTVSEQIRDLEPVEPVTSPEADTYQERDPDAVTAALWRLDPCRLIAPGPGRPGTVDQDSPHTCTLTLGFEQIMVDLGQPLTPGERYGLDPTNVAGAKAYLVSGESRSGGCTAWLPVSFTETIRFEDEFSRCRRVRTVVERAVGRTDDRRGRYPAGKLGDDDTCTLLRRGLSTSGIRDRTVAYAEDGNFTEGLDLCRARRGADPAAGGGSAYATLEVESYVARTDSPSSGWRADFGTIRGREVFGDRRDYAGNCTMRWAESTTVLELETKSCAAGRRIVTGILRVLDDRHDRGIAPQRPVLYAAGQTDRAARGACVDYAPLWFGRVYAPSDSLPAGPACHPYAEPRLPDGSAETVVAAEADPNVTCALATDAVHEQFPDRLRPATLDTDVPPIWYDQPPFRVRPCVFVDPQRRIQVQVFVSSDPLPVAKDAADLLEEYGSDPTIQTVRYGWGYLEGLGHAPDDPGYVAAFVGGRRQHTDLAGLYRLMPGSKDDARRVVEAIVDEHLSG